MRESGGAVRTCGTDLGAADTSGLKDDGTRQLGVFHEEVAGLCLADLLEAHAVRIQNDLLGACVRDADRAPGAAGDGPQLTSAGNFLKSLAAQNGGTYRYLQKVRLPGGNVESTFIDLTSGMDALWEALSERTRLVWFNTSSNWAPATPRDTR